ncbi:UNVERIFIED_CONTAM: hypothetical protein KWD46_15875, partial [Acinetobacter baumannii]
YRIRQTSYPSCNLNFSNLGKLCRQRLYATKPQNSKKLACSQASFLLFCTPALKDLSYHSTQPKFFI